MEEGTELTRGTQEKGTTAGETHRIAHSTTQTTNDYLQHRERGSQPHATTTSSISSAREPLHRRYRRTRESVSDIQVRSA